MVRLAQLIDGRPVYVQGFGGDTSTAIIAAARQRAHVGYISAIGDDMFGEALRELWTREGVDHQYVTTRHDASTGVCFIDPDPTGRRFTYARRGSAASLFDVQDLPLDALSAAGVLHVSGITLAISQTISNAAFRAAAHMKNRGNLVSLDLNHRPALWGQRNAVDVLTQFVELRPDIVFASDDEAAELFGLATPDAIADRFLSSGAEIVVAKQGAKGALLATPERRTFIPPFPSTPVDASGAGDSFAGAFLAWFLETGDPERAAQEAARVAAVTVSGLGAVDSIPRR